ncbi:hypothetical protein NIES4102_07330 [Chondrocystis sp. NIES-4102]|nr:hypothetical protein NIES4102_07330 [Chondrocystis sp. NIES-4102]
MSVIIFNHYPVLLTSPKSTTIFLLTLTAYFFISLDLKKEILILMLGVYILMPFAPYALALLSYHTRINLFETLPIDLIFTLDIDIDNLTQTANKLFLFIAPWSVSIILFLFVARFIVINFLNLIFGAFVISIRYLSGRLASLYFYILAKGK